MPQITGVPTNPRELTLKESNVQSRRFPPSVPVVEEEICGPSMSNC